MAVEKLSSFFLKMNPEQIVFMGVVLWLMSHFVIGHFVFISGWGDLLMFVAINILLMLYYFHCIRVKKKEFS